MSIHDDDNHVDFSDLPTLPSEQIRVLGHVIRNPNISFSELMASLADAETSDGDPVEAGELKQILKKLINKHLLTTTESDDENNTDDGETTYRARMRRKTSQVRTIQGIWKALDADEDLDANIDSEIRRVRSDLADSLLADMSKEQEYDFNAPPPDPEEAKETGQNLLSDLMSAGRSSMSKREGPQPPPVNQPEPRMRTLLDDIAEKKAQTQSRPALDDIGSASEDDHDEKKNAPENDQPGKQEQDQDQSDQQDQVQVLDNLADTLRKQTGIYPVVDADEEKSNLWRKFKDLFGD